MVGLLTLDSSGLNSDHLAQFFRHWKCALGLAPEFISFQTEFHQGARDALSRYAIGLDENDYFEALELLHSSVLTLLDDRHCSADELFDRWTEHNLHTLVLELDSTNDAWDSPPKRPTVSNTGVESGFLRCKNLVRSCRISVTGPVVRSCG